MTKRFLTSLLSLSLFAYAGSVIAQGDCSGGRYQQEIFASYTRDTGIVYGQNVDLNGTNTILKLDVYQPDLDTLSARPLIVMAHGGTFVGGDKQGSDIVPLAEAFTRKGYVCASINYRLGMAGLPFPGPDSTAATEAVMRGVQDAKAAVRFFYKDRATTNLYKVDTNRVYVLGSSAGGFIAVHYAYLDQQGEIPASINQNQASLLGGLDGNSGNPGYSSRIHGIINLAGAIGDSSWITSGDEPIVSLHGTADDVVPYNSTMLVLFGFFPILEVDGSASIHLRADNVGIPNCLKLHYGLGHVPYVGNAALTDTTIRVITGFLSGLTCGTTPVCDNGPVLGRNEIAWGDLSLWPNPNNGTFRFHVPVQSGNDWKFRLCDISGRVLNEISGTTDGDHDFSSTQLTPGMYVATFISGGRMQTLKVVVE